MVGNSKGSRYGAARGIFERDEIRDCVRDCVVDSGGGVDGGGSGYGEHSSGGGSIGSGRSFQKSLLSLPFTQEYSVYICFICFRPFSVLFDCQKDFFDLTPLLLKHLSTTTIHFHKISPSFISSNKQQYFTVEPSTQPEIWRLFHIPVNILNPSPTTISTCLILGVEL